MTTPEPTPPPSDVPDGLTGDEVSAVVRSILSAHLAARDAEWAERVEAVEAERDQLRRGGAELGKSLVFWMELAKTVTGSDDLVDDDGDGDWGVVAERLSALAQPAAAEQEGER